jgi:endonuclease/exonuclease/phosphatase (EEP) superfamily protein YafD
MDRMTSTLLASARRLRASTGRFRAFARRFWPLPLLAGLGVLTAAPFLGEHSMLVDFASQFLLQAAAGTLGLLLLFLVTRHWRSAGLALVALVLQCAVLQPSPFPARAAHDAPAHIEVLFSNVYFSNQRLDALATEILRVDADVVVLAELDRRTGTLLDHLADAYPYRVDCLAHWSCDSAILSRLPLVEDLSAWQAERRIAMSAARLATAFGPIAIAGVHLDQPLPPRQLGRQERQVDGLLEMLARIDDPLLLVGDFNASPWARLMQGLAAGSGLEIAWGIEGTWPAALPWPLRIAIDHALTGQGLVLLDRAVIHLPGTDHKALQLRVGPQARHLAGRVPTG